MTLSTQHDLPNDDLPNDEPSSFLALGDSYTIGQGVDQHHRWPDQLQQRLANHGIAIHRPDYIGATGWTTSQLLTEINRVDPPPSSMVSLSIGVNNQYDGLNVSVYESEFDQLLSVAIRIAGGSQNVFVVSIPDYGVTPFGASNAKTIARQLDQYNHIAQAQCNAANVAFVDVTDISRNIAGDDRSLCDDELHPSSWQYRLWVDRILPVATNILSASSR